MKKIVFLLFVSLVSFAQNSTRKYVSHTWRTGQLNIITSDGLLRISPYSKNIVEVAFIPEGSTLKESHAVVIKPNTSEYNFLENKNQIDLISSGMKVKVKFDPFTIDFYNTQSQRILSDKNGFVKKDSIETIDFGISKDEVLYGGGARALGMNRRGNKLRLYNRAHYGYETKAELMNFCIPLVISSKKYAIHFDNPTIGWLDLDSQKNNTISYEALQGRMVYQVIIGDTQQEVTQNYTKLTGNQPLPPRWALGNFASRFGYRSQEQTEGTIRKFEDTKTPVDAVILDLYWFGKTIKGTMGNLDWDKETFPEPEKMIGDFSKKGVKTILITEPFILTTSSKWNEAVSKDILVKDATGKPCTWDFYFGNTSLVDVFKPEGKTWFWNIYKKLANQGVAGVWGDLGEPEVFPSKAITVAGKADEVHNIYGHTWAKMIFEGYQKDFPKVRPFILMRAGYSGSQRYGMIPWSGDVNRTWGGLQSQMEIALQMGMQGLGYMHSDLGGFAGDYNDNELYLRWLQYGVFNPIFRPHAQEDVMSEVARRDVVTLEKAKKAVELRYRMLPYNYTLAYQNATEGLPLMRPLFFEETANEKLNTVSDTYLWGKDFLIKPITQPNVKTTEVYFPKNSNWYDFYTSKKYIGGTTQAVAVNETTIPTFVRGNVFYPMTELVSTTENYKNSNLDLHFYFEGKPSSEREFYFDDGKNPNAYTDVATHEILNCSTDFKNNKLNIRLESKTYDQELLTEGKSGTIYIYQLTTKPKSVNQNNKSVPFTYDAASKKLSIKYKHVQNTAITITL